MIAAPNGSEIVLRDMRSLLDSDLGELADALTAVLRQLAAAAGDELSAPGG